MLTGEIEQVSINIGLQECYDNAWAILCKGATVVAKDQSKLNQIVNLAADLNTYFTKIAQYKEIDIDLNSELTAYQCSIDEILNDLYILNGQWDDPQYQEFATRINDIVQEIYLENE